MTPFKPALSSCIIFAVGAQIAITFGLAAIQGARLDLSVYAALCGLAIMLFSWLRLVRQEKAYLLYAAASTPRQMYEALLDEGFSDTQALHLLSQQITAARDK